MSDDQNSQPTGQSGQTDPAGGQQQSSGQSGQQSGQPAEPQQQKRSLEDLLSGLEQADRDAVLGEVSKARTEAQSLRKRLRDAEPLAKQAQQAADAQKTAEQRAQEAQAEAEKKANSYRDRAVKAEVKALASADFADPEDAAAFLDLSTYVDDSGEIDSKAIQTDLTDLLKRKPHLGKPTEQGRRAPAPDRSQGSSGNGTHTSDPGAVFAAFAKEQLGF